MREKAVSYHDLEPGFEFPTATYLVTQKAAEDYLDAVEDISEVYDDTGLVAPTALAAYALRGIMESLPLPPGAIHGSQELEFLGETRVGERIRCSGKVHQNSVRGGWRFLSIDLLVNGEDGSPLLKGRTTIILSLK